MGGEGESERVGHGSTHARVDHHHLTARRDLRASSLQVNRVRDRRHDDRSGNDDTIFHGMSLRDSLRNTFSPTYSLDATISPTWKKMSVSAIDAATFTVCCVNSCDAFERLCMAK